MTNDILKMVLSIVPLLFAIILHEVAHGWVAEKLGDPTARSMGRITLNPISHIDPIGTIILPGILLLTHSPLLFGWAKPVPVNFENLRGGRKDMALVALSGPLDKFLPCGREFDCFSSDNWRYGGCLRHFFQSNRACSLDGVFLG